MPDIPAMPTHLLSVIRIVILTQIHERIIQPILLLYRHEGIHMVLKFLIKEIPGCAPPLLKTGC